MKKLFFALLIGLLFASCVGDRKAVQQPQQPEPQQATRVLPTRWMQGTYPEISPTDPVTFYNEFAITIKAKIPKRILMFQDGVTYYVDSSTVVELTINKLTPGVLVFVKRENNLPKIMEISFDGNSPDYNISFYVQSEKSFAQNENCQITFEDKKYKASATIATPDGGVGKLGVNHLLSNFESLDMTNKREETAGGRNATGTKIIKQE